LKIKAICFFEHGTASWSSWFAFVCGTYPGARLGYGNQLTTKIPQMHVLDKPKGQGQGQGQCEKQTGWIYLSKAMANDYYWCFLFYCG
jgi:hypothetical protein